MSALFKLLRVFSGSLALVVALAPAWSAEKVVLVTSFVEHPALVAVRNGIKHELFVAGYVPDKNLKWDFQNAMSSVGNADKIAEGFVAAKPDVVVAISTPSAQALVAATKTVPVVYAGVTDPVAAQLVKDWKISGTNVTGVSDVLDLDRQIDLIKRVVAGAKRVGIVYNPGEANSVVVVGALRKRLGKSGMTLVGAVALRPMDVGAAAQSLVGKVDLIYTNTDNNVASSYESLVKVCNDAHIPLIASDTDSVKRGAVAALGVNYYDLGRQTGKVVVRILKGEKPGEIAPSMSKNFELYVNTSAVQKQGVVLSPNFLRSATKVLN